MNSRINVQIRENSTFLHVATSRLFRMNFIFLSCHDTVCTLWSGTHDGLHYNTCFGRRSQTENHPGLLKNIQCCDSSCQINVSVVPHFILATRKSCWFVLHLEIKLLMKRMINRMQEFLEFETFFKLCTNYFRLLNYMQFLQRSPVSLRSPVISRAIPSMDLLQSRANLRLLRL